MFLRISVDPDWENFLPVINKTLNSYNFEYALKCESYKESKAKFPSETWVIGDGKRADLTLVINIGNRNQEEFLVWILKCLDKLSKN